MLSHSLAARAASAAALLAVVGVVAAPASGARTHAAKTSVTVTATEFHFKLSKKSVPHGTVTFILVNKGHIGHDFKIGGKKTPVVAPGKTAKLTVKLKAGKAPYTCTVPGHAAAGMKGVLKVK
jgi:nitrite reductase (NO-forming)